MRFVDSTKRIREYAFNSIDSVLYNGTLPYAMKVELDDWRTADYPDAPFVEYESELEFVSSMSSI